MRVSLSLPTHRVDLPSLLTAPSIMQVAAAAEAAGFDGLAVTEHPFPDEAWLLGGGHHALDPFVALAVAAAATTRIRLHTNLLIAAYRNPFLAAKAVASLDAVSGGRVTLGIGAGYLEGEYRALGVDMTERNALTDEAIAAMRDAWTGGRVERSGRRWSAAGNRMLPVPAQAGGPPVWIGGNAPRAVRRAIEVGDGWVPMLASAGVSGRVRTVPVAMSDLADRVAEVRAGVDGSRPRPFDVAVSPPGGGLDGGASPNELIDAAGALVRAGVTWLTIGVPGRSLGAILDAIGETGSQVLPAIAGL